MLPIAILAGGLGTRLLPITQQVPKALVPVGGKPFIDHQLALLHMAGIERVVMCVSYLGNMIEEYLGDGSTRGLDISYSYDGEQRVGTAGALKLALPLLGERFFTIYGDSYLRADYADIESAFAESGKSGLMTVYHNENLLAASNVLYRDGEIRAYNKVDPTPEMRYIDYGLSAFRRTAFDRVPTDRQTDLSSVFHDLLLRKDLAGYESQTRFYEVGTPEAIRELERVLDVE